MIFRITFTVHNKTIPLLEFLQEPLVLALTEKIGFLLRVVKLDTFKPTQPILTLLMEENMMVH